MNDPRQSFGAHGEEEAKQFLLDKGYRWLDSNFRTRGGEIDLVMEDGNCLVFVEVKTRREAGNYGQPEEAVTLNKMKHITRTALFYIKAKGFRDKSIRFDVITLDNAGLRHIRDAFQAVGSYTY